METLAKKITNKLIGYLNKNQNEYNVIKYVIQSMLEKWISLVLIGIIIGCMGYEKEYIYFLVIFMSLRSCCGGFHLKTYSGCLVCSFLVTMVVIITSDKISANINVWNGGMIGLAALIPINQMAPVPHINRPMNQKEIRICQKKLKFITVVLCEMILIFCFSNKSWMVVMISEITWIVLIFMIIGKLEYEKEISRKKTET